MQTDMFFTNFNNINSYINYFIDLKDETYIFTVRWNDYCNCAFLNISDYNNNSIISGIALVNNLTIRNNKLPYNFVFHHINNETYEPTIDNIATEFALSYIEGENEGNE